MSSPGDDRLAALLGCVNRRGRGRLQCCLPVTVRLKGERGQGSLIELGAAGARVVSRTSCEAGGVLKLTFSAQAGLLTLESVVAWRQPIGPGFVMGLRFNLRDGSDSLRNWLPEELRGTAA